MDRLDCVRDLWEAWPLRGEVESNWKPGHEEGSEAGWDLLGALDMGKDLGLAEAEG